MEKNVDILAIENIKKNITIFDAMELSSEEGHMSGTSAGYSAELGQSAASLAFS